MNQLENVNGSKKIPHKLDLPIKYVYVNKSVRQVYELADGYYVEVQKIKSTDEFKHIGNSRDDVLYYEFVDKVKRNGLKQTCFFYNKSLKLQYYINRIKTENPELLI